MGQNDIQKSKSKHCSCVLPPSCNIMYILNILGLLKREYKRYICGLTFYFLIRRFIIVINGDQLIKMTRIHIIHTNLCDYLWKHTTFVLLKSCIFMYSFLILEYTTLQNGLSIWKSWIWHAWSIRFFFIWRSYYIWTSYFLTQGPHYFNYSTLREGGRSLYHDLTCLLRSSSSAEVETHVQYMTRCARTKTYVIFPWFFLG